MSNTKIVSFNLRCMWEKDGINSFPHRAGLIYEKMLADLPDIVAFQEVTEPQLALLERLLPEYTFVGHSRSADYKGEGLYTAVRRETFSVLGFEGIWLSPTPHVPASRYEHQSRIPRICVMTKVKNKETGEVLRIFNVHLDHLSSEGRVSQIECLFDFVNEQQAKVTLPAVVLGDLNAYPDSDEIALCNKQQGFTDLTGHIKGTFHDFGRRETPSKIDYIFATPELTARVETVECWKDEKNGIYLSDHYPVCATFRNE